MNKKYLFASMIFGGAMIFTSCSSDDNEIFVGDNFFTDRQAIIDEINALTYPQGFTESDDKHPEYKNMDPEVYTDKKTTEGRGIEGYYGYVDLGLSVKWASSNIGSVSPVTEHKTLEQTLQELEDELGIKPMEKPSFTNNKNNTYPTTMSYEEYLRSMDIKALYSAYNRYNNYCMTKTSAHNDAIVRYNNTQYENHKYLFAVGDGYPWGGLGMWDYLGTKEAPMDIAGNADFDVATYILGEGWSMPTKAQWQELIDKCQWKKYDNYYVVTGPSGKSIVLPCAWYHTSEQTGREVYNVYLYDSKEFKLGGFRELFSIRPVHTK